MGRRALLTVALSGAAGSVGVGTDAWATTEPAVDCVEVLNARSEPTLDESLLSAFGPLAAEPSLVITFTGGQIFTADRAPGGVLVDRYLGGEQYALTFVEDSGAIRWTRCLASGWPLVGDAADVPTGVLVSSSSPDRSELSVIDLATGHDTPLPDALAALSAGAQLAAQNDRYALFTTGGDPATGDVGLGDLALVDLATLGPTTIAVPEQVASGANEFPSYRLAEDGVIGLVSATSGLVTESVFVDGAWTDDPTAIDAALPVTVGVDDMDTMEMVGHSASGSALWEAAGSSRRRTGAKGSRRTR